MPFLVPLALSAQLGAPRVPANTDVPKEVAAWLQSAAIPLHTTNPQDELTDLRALKKTIGNARIVAMGEATHGTHEFFQIKHRMLEFLVERMGFTVFAIEANWPETLAVNDYVLNGKGDPAQALVRMSAWPWNTREMLEMIQWMRAYNQAPSHKKKIKFLGFDMQMTSVAVSNVVAYLQKVDPGAVRSASEAMTPLSNPLEERIYWRNPPESRRATAEGIVALLATFDGRKSDYQKRSSPEEWKMARHNLEIVQQAEQMHSADRQGHYSVRDQAMAQNVKWILDDEPRGTKIMLWAHNGHISTEPLGTGQRMGMRLREIYGKKMVVCGLSFDHGSFQAVQPRRGLRTFSVGPAIPGSLDAALSETGKTLFAVDLRRAPAGGIVGDWLNAAQYMRTIGAIYDPSMSANYYALTYPHSYDVMFFVAQTTAAHENLKRVNLESRGCR